MAGANDGARPGAVIDRGLVADRIAARAAPLPSFDRPSPARTAPATGAAVLVEDVDLARVEATREGTGLALVPFVVRAAIDARGRGPVHVGTGSGVVRDAGALRLRALAAALAGADGDGDATLTVLDGGARLAVLPGAGPVLSVGRVEVRPVARAAPTGEWAMALRPMATLTLAFDPVAMPDAAAFLSEVRERLEQREWGLEL